VDKFGFPIAQKHSLLLGFLRSSITSLQGNDLKLTS